MRGPILLVVLFVSVCRMNAQEEKIEYQHNDELDYYYRLPSGWNLVENEAKLFPLVIYLHGGGGYGKFEGLGYLAYSDGAFQSTCPSFVLVPQSKKGWDPGKITPLIESFKLMYPVDNRCIYLIGYSMGGSGSYILANG